MVLYHHSRKVAKNTSLAHIGKNEQTCIYPFDFYFLVMPFKVSISVCVLPLPDLGSH